MGVGAGLDLVPLFELPVKERVQPVPAGTEGIDLAHGREYRKPPVSEIGGTGRAATGGAVCASGHHAFVRVVCESRAVGAVEVPRRRCRNVGGVGTCPPGGMSGFLPLDPATACWPILPGIVDR